MKRTNLVLDGRRLVQATQGLGAKTYSAAGNIALKEVIRLRFLSIHPRHSKHMQNRIGVGLWALGLWWLTCANCNVLWAGHESQVTFVISPNPALMDDRVTIKVVLMAGSLYPEINGVVGVSSSHVLWEGATAKMLPGGPAWTHGGKPLPYVPFHIGAGFAARYFWSGVSGHPLSLKPMFIDSLSRVDTDDAQIAVERIHGPVLLASGGDDREWPSTLMSARAMDRLRRNHHPYSDEHLSYEGVGHWIPSAYLPTGGLRGLIADEIGGGPAATARAQSQCWPKMLQFLTAIPSQRDTR